MCLLLGLDFPRITPEDKAELGAVRPVGMEIHWAHFGFAHIKSTCVPHVGEHKCPSMLYHWQVSTHAFSKELVISLMQAVNA